MAMSDHRCPDRFDAIRERNSNSLKRLFGETTLRVAASVGIDSLESTLWRRSFRIGSLESELQ